jgi:hypothetical protein
MQALRKTIATLVLASFALPLSAQVQTDSSQQVIAFVQHFYDWYLPIALDQQKHSAYSLAITSKPTLFDATLLRALRDDAAAQTKAMGEIDGLDFDPFLNAQDPPAHYKAVRATGSLVTVIGFDQQTTQPAVALLVEVRCNGNRCVLVNFHYPANGSTKQADLLAILRILHPSAQNPR